MMKLCVYCLVVLSAVIFAGCVSAEKTAECRTIFAEYETLSKNSSLQKVTLKECLERAGTPLSWQELKDIICCYYALGMVQIAEKELLEDLSDCNGPAVTAYQQTEIAEAVRKRTLASVNLCQVMKIYPGTPLQVDFKVPEKLPPLTLPELKVMEKAVLVSPLLKQFSTVEKLAVFHREYVSLIAAREKCSACFNSGDPRGKLEFYCAYSAQLQLLGHLLGVEEFNTANIKALNEKIFFLDPASRKEP